MVAIRGIRLMRQPPSVLRYMVWSLLVFCVRLAQLYPYVRVAVRDLYVLP